MKSWLLMVVAMTAFACVGTDRDRNAAGADHDLPPPLTPNGYLWSCTCAVSCTTPGSANVHLCATSAPIDWANVECAKQHEWDPCSETAPCCACTCEQVPDAERCFERPPVSCPYQ